MKRIAFKTLGCRLNQYETDALVSAFDNRNYSIVDFEEPADILVVNTCTVTNRSDHKSRNIISQARRKNKDALVIVTGCMVNNPKSTFRQDHQVYAIENIRKNSIPQIVDAHFRGEIYDADDFAPGNFSFEVPQKSFHTRSMIKIQDGCDNFCAYCIVPKVRGRAISRPVGDIMDSIRRSLDLGYKEMVLTGVNISRYQYETFGFSDLIEKVLEIPGDFRLRISSMEPDSLDDKFYDLLDHPKMAPHLHLCLQSGSDSVLLKMRRMYSVTGFRKIVDRIRSKHPYFNFTTDIIVGFPGETEEDFQDSLQEVKEIGFSHVHTFKYSVREGTRAARMDGKVPEEIKTARSEQIRNLSEQNKKTYYESMVDKNQRVLIERINGSGIARGYGQHYIPFELPVNGNPETNVFRDVIIRSVRNDHVTI